MWTDAPAAKALAVTGILLFNPETETKLALSVSISNPGMNDDRRVMLRNRRSCPQLTRYSCLPQKVSSAVYAPLTADFCDTADNAVALANPLSFLMARASRIADLVYAAPSRRLIFRVWSTTHRTRHRDSPVVLRARSRSASEDT